MIIKSIYLSLILLLFNVTLLYDVRQLLSLDDYRLQYWSRYRQCLNHIRWSCVAQRAAKVLLKRYSLFKPKTLDDTLCHMLVTG